MIKISYEPLTELVIKEIVRYEKIEDLVYPFAQLRASGQPVALFWTNGIVFINVPLNPDTDQLIEEYMQGKVYWATVSFCIMSEYKPVLETKEKIQVPIINASSNPMLNQVAEWLKNQKNPM